MAIIFDTLAPIEVVDNYGAPKYGLIGPAVGKPLAVAIGHTPENASIYLSSAVAVTDWQATSGNTSGGSYHAVEACKDGTDPANYRNWVFVRSVPWNYAAGGLALATNPVAWLRALLPAWALGDPNAHAHQFSLSGKAAWYQSTPEAKWHGATVRLAQMIRVLERAYQYDAVLSEHTHWQPPPNRYDIWGREFDTYMDVVMVEYNRQSQTATAPAPTPTPTDPRDKIIAEKNAALDRILTERLPAAEAAVKQLRESTQFTRNL